MLEPFLIVGGLQNIWFIVIYEELKCKLFYAHWYALMCNAIMYRPDDGSQAT